MTDNKSVEQNEGQFENPLVWPLFEVLQELNQAWKVHTLSAYLIEKGLLKQLDESIDKDLFKRNFLIMNALYQLQTELYPEQWLQVEAMNIQLFSELETKNNQQTIDAAHPLREYYLDWINYQVEEGEVQRLLNEFWNNYRRYLGGTNASSMDRIQALKRFGLSESATEKEIRKQWRKLAMQHHPDRESGNAEQFRVMCEAWNVLR
ncbi:MULTISPECIES: DNA-J related domain-containing protein [Aliivibrio]|uniref:Molecular chaperone DnaJ n=1 Tax=Aliivibrio logei TaxID=688 RepID=A0A1B9NTP8_ALILO|nr:MULTISPECIES: DNA-J related domain-containing protein [Aliivibrio]MBB1315121.1 DnaJ domain-containing protein [Aliivibrio sp. SR45-2]OCH17036.1 molecular chaperone DnaJ [Aliivibrio logei]